MSAAIDRQTVIELIAGMEIDGELLNAIQDAMSAADGEEQMAGDVLGWGELAEVCVAVVITHLLNRLPASPVSDGGDSSTEATG